MVCKYYMWEYFQFTLNSSLLYCHLHIQISFSNPVKKCSMKSRYHTAIYHIRNDNVSFMHQHLNDLPTIIVFYFMASPSFFERNNKYFSLETDTNKHTSNHEVDHQETWYMTRLILKALRVLVASKYPVEGWHWFSDMIA